MRNKKVVVSKMETVGEGQYRVDIQTIEADRETLSAGESWTRPSGWHAKFKGTCPACESRYERVARIDEPLWYDQLRSVVIQCDCGFRFIEVSGGLHRMRRTLQAWGIDCSFADELDRLYDRLSKEQRQYYSELKTRLFFDYVESHKGDESFTARQYFELFSRPAMERTYQHFFVGPSPFAEEVEND